MFRSLIALSTCVLLSTQCVSDDGLFDQGASTVQGDILESRGELAEGLGKGALLQSLSARQLQEAIDKGLSNRKERIEMYYELRETRNEEIKSNRPTASERRQLAEKNAPNRLNNTQLDRETGQIFWPKPLDHVALKPYRKPIEDTLDKRSDADQVYREFDYLKVHRMIVRIKEAVETIADKMDAREVVALTNYLDQIDYEARFDIDDNRVDY